MNSVFHHTGPMERDRIYPDGNAGYTLLETVIEEAGKVYLLPHGQGRPIEQYQVVRANRCIGIPFIATDPQGREINDREMVGLVFTNILDETPVTVRLKFA
jgi:hypothetical protein